MRILVTCELENIAVSAFPWNYSEFLEAGRTTQSGAEAHICCSQHVGLHDDPSTLPVYRASGAEDGAGRQALITECWFRTALVEEQQAWTLM